MTFDRRARFEQDHERARLRELDINFPREGNSRLLEWTLLTKQNEEPELMAARKKATTAKASTQASELVAALQFVSVAGTKDDAAYKTHVTLNNKFAVACDGQISAGHPIAEELECCPQLKQLTAALLKCGNSLSIAELPNGQLSITGEKLMAKIPCIAFDALPDSVLTQPDAVCAVIDDRIKCALAACGVLVNEGGDKPHLAGMLLEANACTSTNGVILLQYWHGIDLPPGLFLPKIFCAAVCKIKAPLVGFGWTAGRSVTFHFEGGAWIKTQLYEDKYPAVDAIINLPTVALPVPEGLFEAIETVAAFDEQGFAQLEQGKVSTANADFEVDGLTAACRYASEYTRLIAPFAKTIDLTTYADRAFFFGDSVRGVIMGLKAPHVETTEEWRARGGSDDEIPF